MRIAVIDKFPTNLDYSKYFDFDFDVYHLCQYRKEKILKKDIDIKINTDEYDFIILIGAEAVKHFTKKSIGSLSGHIVNEKYIPLFNPAIVVFRPENKQSFEAALKRLHDNIAGTSSVDNSGTFLGITDSKIALEYLTNILNSVNPVVSLDTETTAVYPRDGYVLGISICNSERNSAYILSDCLEEEHLNILQQIIDTKEIVFHNAKFDISMMQYHFNLVFNKDNINDTLIMHYLLDETVGTHDLKSLALKYTKFGDYDDELEVFKKEYCRRHGVLQDNFTYDLIPFDIIYLYAAKDAAVTYELYSMFKNILYNTSNNKLLSVYNNIMIPALFLLIEMENNGIPFDIDRLKFAKEYLDTKIKQAKDSLYAMQEVKDFEQLQKAPLNTNSPVQLRKFFFDFLKLKGEGKRTGAGKLSTDAEVLESLKKQHPAVDIIVTLRKLSKLKNTYVDSLICTLDKDGRIRTNFNQTTTTSGRLSSSGKFNAQQLPRDDPIIKGTIKAKSGFKIVSQDLQTGEMYVAAVLSKDKQLREVFTNREDFHSSIAKKVFKLNCLVSEVKELFKTFRQSAKAISFGILYGSGAEKVADTVNKDATEEFTIDEAQAAITDYFTTFYSLKNWLDSCKEVILQQGYIYSAFGRKRRLKNVTSKDKNIVAHECRSGINFLVQSVCSDINLLAAIEFSQLIKKHKLNAKIIMLVHDSIVLEVAEDDIDLTCSLLKVCTQKDRGVSIPGCPIGVDQEIGDDYSFGKFEDKYGDLIQESNIGISVLGENMSKIIEDIYDNIFEESEIPSVSST